MVSSKQVKVFCKGLVEPRKLEGCPDIKITAGIVRISRLFLGAILRYSPLVHCRLDVGAIRSARNLDGEHLAALDGHQGCWEAASIKQAMSPSVAAGILKVARV